MTALATINASAAGRVSRSQSRLRKSMMKMEKGARERVDVNVVDGMLFALSL